MLSVKQGKQQMYLIFGINQLRIKPSQPDSHADPVTTRLRINVKSKWARKFRI